MLLRIVVMRRAQRLGLVVCVRFGWAVTCQRGTAVTDYRFKPHENTEDSLGPSQNRDDDIMLVVF